MQVINLIGGPGAGKSTTAALLYAKLKLQGKKVELVTEYAKEKVWESNSLVLENQIYIFAKQLHKMFRLKDKLDYIITDAPILLSLYYAKDYSLAFKQLVLDEFNKFNNVNYFIKRTVGYTHVGRLQTEEEALKIDSQLRTILSEFDIKYKDLCKGDVTTLLQDIKDGEWG